ncbi:uncharacterized protein LOC133286415 [Gastrolobium bilobum]|uniref:uncharacterized protein LOC133286415 n=1 Tax=Gastrolobium bilobum TaxID=150636 RepID=UPI002AB12F68|nr:uncharacterized protein LOC133286415 [Gastrolobium bilobum]
MSNFCGCHALVMLLFLCLVFVLGSPAAGQDNPLFELLSRDEVVQMAGYGEERLSTVLVTGSVNCEARFHNGDQPHAWPIPGASVAVNCQSHASEGKGKPMVAQGVTDEFGDFMVDLPSYLHAIPNLEKICAVKVHRIPKGSLCRPAHVKKYKGLELSSFGNGIRTYNAGNIRMQHSTSEPLHAPSIHGGKE